MDDERRSATGPVDETGDRDMVVLGEGARSRWRTPRDTAPIGVTAETLLAAGAVVVLGPWAGQLQRLALGVEGFFWAGVVLSGLVAGGLGALLHRWLAGGPRWAAATVGLVTGLVAASAWAGVTTSALTVGLPHQVLGAVALGLAVVAVRLGRDPRGYAAAAASAVSLGLVGLTVAQATGYFFAPSTGAAAEAAPAGEAEGAPEPPPVDAPGPTIGDLCHPDEMTMATSRPEKAMHDVYTTVTATNEGDRSCELNGFPTVSLIGNVEQDDLMLSVHVSEVDPATGEKVRAAPVVVEPGESAEVMVWWQAWGAAADTQSPQQLRIGVSSGVEALDLPQQDRWDVVQSADAWVGAWRAVPQGED